MPKLLLKNSGLLFCRCIVFAVCFVVVGLNAVDVGAAQTEVGQEDQAASQTDEQAVTVDYFGRLLDTFSGNADGHSKSGFAEISTKLPAMFPDLAHSFINVSTTKSGVRAFGFLAGILALLVVSVLVEKWVVRWIGKKYLQSEPGSEADKETISFVDKVGMGLVKVIPGLLGIVVFLMLSYAGYALIFPGSGPGAKVLFVALLLSVVGYRATALLADFLFAPGAAGIRPLPVSDTAAVVLRRLVVQIFTYIVSGFLLAAAFSRLGALPITVLMSKVVAASILLVIVALAALRHREHVKEYLLAPTPEHPDSPSRGWKNFAEIWHVFFILYCLVLWGMLVNSTADPGSTTKGAFLFSFFIVPIWVILDRLLVLIVRYGVGILKIYDFSTGTENVLSDEEQLERAKGLNVLQKTLCTARGILAMVLIAWLASLWGYRLPFVSVLIKAIFDSILVIALALTLWRFISNWIEKKIAEEEAGDDEVDEEAADEFGGAVARGRAYTLLPILRKFIGVVLGVMVTLTVLSSLGVNIGPLLAGAGVVGLAVGFGAQKLVADILSGFFYLFDDAFRVGEYLTTGSVSGTVEGITLRNVMLRHHRGMLQIIPHSELGTITNYMRGGIIDKFNLDFPYDTDIDQIRKIIKKVGIAMMEDPEYADGFIRPIKSQGVREISNSVMTIRVKFTAKPGKQFVIRREAFKRITEAINAKGIHYAHRKVIVDIPQVNGDVTPQTEQAVKAAGAAARQIIDEEQAAQEKK